MKAAIAITIVCFILAVGAGVSGISERLDNNKLRAKLRKDGATQSATSQELDLAHADIGALESKLSSTTMVITNQTGYISSLQGRLAELSKLVEQLQSLSTNTDITEHRAMWAGEIPAPSAIVTTDEDGRENKSFVFRKLIGSDGLILGTNATFIRSFGRSLIFKMTSGSRARFDIDDVHPGVLTHLGVDVAESAKAQEIIEEERKRRRERDAILAQILAAKWSEESKLRFEQSLRAGEVAAQAQAALAQEHMAQVQSRKTSALERAAEAAMMNALKPAVQVNVQQTVF